MDNSEPSAQHDGTLGLEIFKQMPDLETAVIQLSGGGLMAGVATALKAENPNIRIVAVTMDNGPAMYECVKAGKYVEVEELPTLADSLGGGIGENNQYTFPMVRDLVDDYVLVSETEIAEAIRHAYWEERQIIEGSGSVAIAAALSGKINLSGKTVLLCSGGNIDMKLHHRIISGENVDVTKENK
ncbi:MAG: pyridoxal-phosphate dependent enzyme [Pseudomonadota bacterium]